MERLTGNYLSLSKTVLAKLLLGSITFTIYVAFSVSEIFSAEASGPLQVNRSNSRYFTDKTRKAIYLSGSHTWGNLQDNGTMYPPPFFNYSAFLDFLGVNNHNFFRLWTWEQSKWTNEIAGDYWIDPMPYQRTGPGSALDGKLKFNLTKFNQAYFDRVRSRTIAAGQRGIYVSIMLFNGWSIEAYKGTFGLNNPWKGHPFNGNNNINAIDGDTNANGSGEEVHTLQDPSVTAIQKAYIRKVVDSVNDLDNVLYEISNESHGKSVAWQYDMIDYVKSYEAAKPKQHPVGMTVAWPGGSNSDLFSSPADWISPNRSGGNYLNDPEASNGYKVIVSDTDHLCGKCGDRYWVWKSFLRGMNPIFMDGYDGAAIGLGAAGFYFNEPKWQSLRKNLGYTLTYANKMNLAKMTPQNYLSSTGYCLANAVAKGAEYLVYLPSGGSATLNLKSTTGNLSVEWFEPSTGAMIQGRTSAGGAIRSFTAPFSGDAVLYLKVK